MPPHSGTPLVKVSAKVLLILCVILMLGGFGLLQLQQSVFAAVVFALLSAIVTFGFLGATGLVKTKGYQFGGSAAIFLVTFVLIQRSLPHSSPIRGTVFLDGVPIRQAQLVLLHVNARDVKRELNGDDGFFEFGEVVLDGKEIVFSVKIPEFDTITKTNQYRKGTPVIINIQRKELRRSPKVTEFGVPNSLAGMTDYGYKSPPLLKASVIADAGRPDLLVRFDKARQAIPRPVPPDEITIAGGTQGAWSAVINTKRLMEKHFPTEPHGNYRAAIGFNGASPSLFADVNYVFKDDAVPPAQLLEGRTSSFAVGRAEIVATNRSRNGGFVSVRLLQGFDFRYNFAIRGMFRIEALPSERQCTAAFDLTLGDEDSDRVSVILGEDAGDSYSIKMMGEGIQLRGDEGKMNKKQDSGTFVAKDGITANCFEIRILADQDRRYLWYRLYYSRRPTDSRNEAPLFSRRLPADLLIAGATRIRLRVWGNGVVRLRNLEIAELSGAGG